jgi:hypothetical protein
MGTFLNHFRYLLAMLILMTSSLNLIDRSAIYFALETCMTGIDIRVEETETLILNII